VQEPPTFWKVQYRQIWDKTLGRNGCFTPRISLSRVAFCSARVNIFGAVPPGFATGRLVEISDRLEHAVKLVRARDMEREQTIGRARPRPLPWQRIGYVALVVWAYRKSCLLRMMVRKNRENISIYYYHSMGISRPALKFARSLGARFFPCAGP